MMEDRSLRMQSTGPKKGSEVWYVFQRTEAWDDIGYTAIPRRLWGTYRAGDEAAKGIRRSTEETFQQTVTGYDSVKVENSSIQLHGGKAKYALFPVWLLSTSWRGENYLFAMNGQSGKFVGDLPVDKGAARKWMLGLTAALSAASYGVMWLLWLARIL